MATEIYGADKAGTWPVRCLRAIVSRRLEPGQAASVALDGQLALMSVQKGMFAIGARDGPRALPGEWVLARGGTFDFGNPSRVECMVAWCLVFDAPEPTADLATLQRYFTDDQKANKLCTVALPDSDNGALGLGVEARIYVASLGRWSTVLHDLAPGRAAVVFVLSGDGTVNNQALECGGSACIYDEDEVRISGGAGADVILIEVPMATTGTTADG